MNLIGAKVYYDVSHWIAIPHMEKPHKRRRKRITTNDETVEQFEKAFKSAPKGKTAKKKEKLLKSFYRILIAKPKRQNLLKNSMND